MSKEAPPYDTKAPDKPSSLLSPLQPTAPPAGPPPPFQSQAPSTTTGTTTTTDEPPPYDLRPDAAHPDPDELLPPTTFVIHGRFLYTTSSPNPGEADSDPSYQLSRAIHTQGQATEKIDLSRMDLRVRISSSTDTPTVARRAKEIYTLEHRKEMRYAGLPFQAWIEPRSRKGLGKVMLEKGGALARYLGINLHAGSWSGGAYNAVRVVDEEEMRWRAREGLKEVRDGECFFVVREKGRGEGWWQWCDGGTGRGKVLADQVRVPVGSGLVTAGNEQGSVVEHRLRVLEPMSRRARDGLVALWCLWMWHLHIDETKPKRTWEDRKRILQMPKEYYTGYTATPLGGSY